MPVPRSLKKLLSVPFTAVVDGMAAGSGPMGVSGGVFPSAPYDPNAFAQSSQLQGLQGLLGPAPWACPMMSISVREAKIQAQARTLVDALPMSIAGRIHTLEFYPAFQNEPARFSITFNNSRSLTFYDIDVFPSEEHIARIALECP